MKEYYVYIYLDPRKPGEFIYENFKFDYEPFYVGKGSGNRIDFHLSLKGKNKHLLNKINNILEENLNPIRLKLFSSEIEKDVFAFEKQTVNFIGRSLLNEGPLVNIRPGGEEKIGFNIEIKEKIAEANKKRIVSDETKLKMSRSHEGSKNFMYGKTHSLEAKEKIREAHKGKLHSDDSKEKMSKARKGKSFHTNEQLDNIKNYMSNRIISEETLKKFSEAKSIKVFYYLDNIFQQEFPSYKETAIFFNIAVSAIAQTIKRCNNGKFYKKNVLLLTTKK